MEAHLGQLSSVGDSLGKLAFNLIKNFRFCKIKRKDGQVINLPLVLNIRCTAKFVSSLVENPEDKFSCDAAQIRAIYMDPSDFHRKPYGHIHVHPPSISGTFLPIHTILPPSSEFVFY